MEGATVAKLHPEPHSPKGLDATTAVKAAFALDDAYRQAAMAGKSDITTATVHALVDRYGADAVIFALEVRARLDFDEATELCRYFSTREVA